jgi:hypothetical protein
MRGNPVIAAPDALKARFFAVGINRQRCLHGLPEQGLTRELLCRGVNLPHMHRVPGLFEHQRYGLEYRAHLGGSRAGFTRIDQGLMEQLGVQRP